MFDYLFQWIQNIASYMLLATVAIQLVPNDSYKKYIRFFTGLLLIVLLAAPLLKLFEMDSSFQSIYQNEAYQQQVEDIEETTKYLETVTLPDEDVSGANSGKVEEEIQIGEIQIGE